MPELPEVETIANGVHRRIHGDSIVSVWFSHYREPFKTPAAEMEAALAGLRIARVARVGKHIVFDLAPKGGRKVATQWIVHLGMTGRLLVSSAEVPVPPHTHAILRLASGRELRFVDPRRFGRLALHSDGGWSVRGSGARAADHRARRILQRCSGDASSPSRRPC